MVKAKITECDLEKKRVSLSIRALIADSEEPAEAEEETEAEAETEAPAEAEAEEAAAE